MPEGNSHNLATLVARSLGFGAPDSGGVPSATRGQGPNPVSGSARDGGAAGGISAGSARGGSAGAGGAGSSRGWSAVPPNARPDASRLSLDLGLTPLSGSTRAGTAEPTTSASTGGGDAAAGSPTGPTGSGGGAGGMDWKTIAMLSLLGIPIAGLGSYGAYKMMGGGKKRDEEKRSSVRDLAAEKLSRLLITVKQANALPAATEDFVQYMTTAAVKLPAEKVAGVVNLCRYVREGHSVVDALHKQNPSWTREQCKAAAARLVHAVYN